MVGANAYHFSMQRDGVHIRPKYKRLSTTPDIVWKFKELVGTKEVLATFFGIDRQFEVRPDGLHIKSGEKEELITPHEMVDAKVGQHRLPL